ncbi:unnamed protein product [Phytophthora fragariaefolia]|uniref:Unnamed protein product n=1 Tax=Phytophthora fragariaefolia TaxID=1490495 RepID=A0A9W6WPQ9_9STRA|nr:unnamed protein product [Phytophthora fragariaefolia]
MAELRFHGDNRSAGRSGGRRATRRPDSRASVVLATDEDREAACARPEIGGVSDSEAGYPVDRKKQETVKEEPPYYMNAGLPTEIPSEPAIPFTQSVHLIDTAPTRDPTLAAPEPPVALKSEVAEEEQICCRGGGSLFAEAVEQHMALLPEMVSTTDEVTIEDIQAGDPDFNTPEEIDRLRQIIWRPGATCSAPVSREAFATDQRLVFREDHPTVDLSFGIPDRDHHQEERGRHQGLHRLSASQQLDTPDGIIHAPDQRLARGLGKVLCYCSLDMVSGFWVVTMTPRAREISAVITPSGLFEWLRMPFGLKKAPQIYQCLVDNALYGHLKISTNSASALPIDVFKDGAPEMDQMPSVLGRRSYIDDILVIASDWDVLCQKVEKLMEACDRWNLSISVVKSFWGLRKVDYLGHRVSVEGEEAHPKDWRRWPICHSHSRCGRSHVKRGGGAYGVIVWKLPGWVVLAAGSEYAPDQAVNEAEYPCLLLCFDLLVKLDRGCLIVCGESNLVIRQMRGEIDCKAPALQLLRQKALDQLRSWPQHEFLHMKREWNQSADRLASTALQKEEGTHITSDEDRQDLVTLNRLDELLKPKVTDQIARVTAITRSARRRRLQPETLQEAVVQQMRGERIAQAQNEEKWIVDLNTYLRGDLADLTSEEAKACSKIASDYEVDDDGLLFYCPATVQSNGDRDLIARLVVPETLHQDFLQHYHTSLEGGHQGIGRTYQLIRAHFHGRGLYRSVQRYVGECIDCEAGKGRPVIRGPSPGNLQPTYPFQIVIIEHIPSLPKLFKENTELLIWVGLFTGYVIAKASASLTAQTTAENDEECVFRRFSASEAISQWDGITDGADSNTLGEDVCRRCESAGLGRVYRATYVRPQNRPRPRPGCTPFYLTHGRVPRTTLEASLPLASTRRRDRSPRRWRSHVQAHYQRAREQVRGRLREAIRERADQHNEQVIPHGIEAGVQVWLYLNRVEEGYARKLAHMWHGPFRISEMVGDYAARIKVAGVEYRLFPIVHVPKLKPVKHFPDRPRVELVSSEADRLDLDEALLAEDSWEATLAEDEFEVDRIVNVRSGRRTRYGRVHREFLVYWKAYPEPPWVDEADLNCGSLLQKFERKIANRNRFQIMQSREEEEEFSLTSERSS